MEGLGLAQVKAEGFIIPKDDSDGTTCYGFDDEFNKKLGADKFPWYLRWLGVEKIASDYWCEALLENERSKTV